MKRFTIGVSTHFAWQNWALAVPRSWNPVKLEGTYARGLALLADMDRARVAIRWETPRARGRGFDADGWARRAMREEVGSLAASEAKTLALAMGRGALIYVDPDPPGRDVFVACSAISGRCIQIIHHAHKRGGAFTESIVPSLDDTDPGASMRWSIFDLACASPAGYRLASQRLNAGDLALTFEKHRDWLTLRRISIARLALARRPLEGWLADQCRGISTHYATSGEPAHVEVASMGQSLAGLSQTSIRRRRFGWMRWLGRHVTTLALHDPQQDRLIFVGGTDHDQVMSLARSTLRCDQAPHAPGQTEDHQVADALG